MMLLATLSILAGATVRMPILFPVFGTAGWVGIFGPIFVLGLLFLLVRFVMIRAVDRWFLAGYTGMLALYITASQLALSDAWGRLAKTIFNS